MYVCQGTNESLRLILRLGAAAGIAILSCECAAGGHQYSILVPPHVDDGSSSRLATMAIPQEAGSRALRRFGASIQPSTSRALLASRYRCYGHRLAGKLHTMSLGHVSGCRTGRNSLAVTSMTTRFQSDVRPQSKGRDTNVIACGRNPSVTHSMSC